MNIQQKVHKEVFFSDLLKVAWSGMSFILIEIVLRFGGKIRVDGVPMM
jgi:hypothetical protein